MNSTQLITEAHEHQKGKVCNKCNKHQPLSEFHINRNNKDGLQNFCRSCAKAYMDTFCPFNKWYIKHPPNAKINNIEFTIEPEDIPGVKITKFVKIDTMGRPRKKWEALEYPKICPVLGVELIWDTKERSTRVDNSPSLDRINPKLGYIKGNVMIMSNLANQMKSNATPEQLKQFSRYFLFEKNNGS